MIDASDVENESERDDYDTCVRLARDRVRACMEACVASAPEEANCRANAILSVSTLSNDDADADDVVEDDVSDVEDAPLEDVSLELDARASSSEDAAFSDLLEREKTKRHAEVGTSVAEDARELDVRALVRALEDERANRQKLEAEMDARDASRAAELEALAAKMRDADAGRAEAEAESSHLRGELARIETVIRQEEGVIRLRLEAEHEVRVGRLATELDRVRGELEARSEDLELAIARDEKTFAELESVRENLLGRLKSETQTVLGTIDRVFEAMASASKALHRDDGETPRVSQSVPSRRDRTLVLDVSRPAARAQFSSTALNPSTPRSSRRLSGSASTQQQTPSRRIQVAQTERRTKPLASRSLVGHPHWRNTTCDARSSEA